MTLEPKHFPCDDTAATRLVIAAKLQSKDAHKLSLELARALWEPIRRPFQQSLSAPVSTPRSYAQALLRTSNSTHCTNSYE